MKKTLAFVALFTIGAGAMVTMDRYQQAQAKQQAEAAALAQMAPCCDPPICPPVCSK